MTRKAFFCYEQGTRGPVPVVYYDEMPRRNVKEDKNKQEKIIDVSHLLKLPDLEVSISECVRLYPFLTSESSGVSVTTEELKMVKPVTGFLSRNGERFFDTEAKAVYYDAAFELRTAATDAVVALGIGNETHVTALVEAFEKFLADEADLVLTYLSTARRIQAETKNPDGMDRSPAGDNSPDDQGVRPSSDNGVAKTASPETDAKKPRTKPAPPTTVPGE